jgi:hypothetical protein
MPDGKEMNAEGLSSVLLQLVRARAGTSQPELAARTWAYSRSSTAGGVLPMSAVNITELADTCWRPTRPDWSL